MALVERARFEKLVQWTRHHPAEMAMLLGAVAVTAYVVAYPLMVVHYPPITDLPFHAASMSILRHYLDPSWHFQEQFSLHFLQAPYWTMSGLGALFAFILPIVWAAKLTVIVLLALLPIGLSVLFHGMRKSPYLGLLGLVFVWNTLTHWGFVNFTGAIGLFAMVMGYTLLVLDKPTRGRQVGLALSLLAVFGTHIFRFPFALAAVVGTTLAVWPSTRRWKPVVLPLVPSLVALVVWLAVRTKELSGQGMEPLRPHWDRFAQAAGFLFNGFSGPEEQHLASISYGVLGATALVCLASFVIERRWRAWSRADLWWAVGTQVAVLSVVAVFLAMYLTLPMEIGIWWYVYPREIVSAVFMALALCPNLPSRWWAKFPVLAAVGYATMSQAFFVAKSYHEFDQATADFRQITRAIPSAPKLGYMVFDHSGSSRASTPFIHLPAWVQAEKGGWLSFHFVIWNAWPIRYRTHSAAVPPPTPLRFEWLPWQFDVRTRGKFFDWFLVRSVESPEHKFRADPSIQLVEHVGTWWLYHRQPGAEAQPQGQ